MRITSMMIYNRLSRAIQGGLEDYAEINARLGTGKKINKPSDDVTGTMRAMGYRVNISDNARYIRNIDEATSQLTFLSTAMKSVSETIAKVKEAAISGASGTLDTQISAALALETQGYRDLFLDLGNSAYLGRYIFSGFWTDQPAFDSATYDYQGDAGVMNVQVDKAAAMPVNVVGSEAFSYTLAAPEVAQISGGRFAHYTPGAGTTIQVEIRDTDDITVLDTFTFSNVIQMTDIVSAAFSANDPLRLAAMLQPLDRIREQMSYVEAQVGARLDSLNNQSKRLGSGTVVLQNALSGVEEADMAETAMELNKADTALQALLEASGRILSQSLFDFLR